jgi:hypothetical protein
VRVKHQKKYHGNTVTTLQIITTTHVQKTLTNTLKQSYASHDYIYIYIKSKKKAINFNQNTQAHKKQKNKRKLIVEKT